MVMTLSDLRQKRDANERQEMAERNEMIRTKLVPLLLCDLRGELSEELGLSLLELCDDFEISEEQYADLQKTAKAIAQDFARAAAIDPQIEDEKIRYARFAIGRRRAEQQGLAANSANRRQEKLRDKKMRYGLQLDLYRDSHAFFFGVDGKPLPTVLSLPIHEREEAVIVNTNCPICLTDFENADSREYCSERCDSIAATHFDALVELKILKRKKKS